MTGMNINMKNRVKGGEVFFAGKLPGKKDAFRADAIPEAFAVQVRVETAADGSGKVLICAKECLQTVEFQNADELHNIVVAYEATEDEVFGFDGQLVKTGWNAWHKANAATTLVEVDGVFYANKTQVVQMQLIDRTSDMVPELVTGAAVSYKDGNWYIQTDWGVSSTEAYAEDEVGFWAKYGVKENGAIDANIIGSKTKSFGQYYLCTEDGDLICPLSECL